VLVMTATTFLTQRQLMSKNMPPDAMSGPYAQQQKMLLYVLPLAFGVGGVAFPIGVLLYWTTSNTWTMGQQFYVIRNNPAPGTPAQKAKEERDARKAARKAERHGPPPVEDTAPSQEAAEPTKPATPPRQQPKRQSRSQRKKKSPPSGPDAARPGDETEPGSASV
jgi:YidC/Oxa1 family membrane protein insertase